MHIDINVKGVILGTFFAQKMMQNNTCTGDMRGHVINVSSMAAVAPVTGVTLYAASKYAVRGFSFAAAKDLKPLGICVSCLMPDAVATPMIEM